ncbi:MAG: HD domain-containing protein [Selenomonadaceae bacterium]|nr:HD domain-containing protein [Selenomonadaceae bacterium]
MERPVKPTEKNNKGELTESEFAAAIRMLGGRAFIVGGYVRDFWRGASPHDRDYVLTGVTEADFCQKFPTAKKVGRSFPVYLLTIDGQACEVAFGRRERKAGSGYTGFQVDFSATVTIEEDLSRRDTTINAMAMELPAKNLLDPYGGREDIKRGLIRAVSERFKEDPVRALRAARQATEFSYTIEANTIKLMAECREELKKEPTERIFHEMERALAAERPSLFFRYLQKANLLADNFPEIAALRGKTQPAAFHPEGDAFEHTMLLLDKVAAQTTRPIARFAALCHDLGKGTTPEEMLPHHYGHEVRGADVLQSWNSRMTLPHRWLKAAVFVSQSHMKAPRLKKPGKIRDLLLAVKTSFLTFAEYNAIILADSGALPWYLACHAECLSAIESVNGRQAPPNVRGAAIGEWLRKEQIRRLVAVASSAREQGNLSE